MDSRSYSGLVAAASTSMQWTTTGFDLPLQHHPFDITTTTIDICTTIGKRAGSSRIQQQMKLWFPEEVVDDSTIRQLLKKAGIRAGFIPVTRSSMDVRVDSVAYRINCSRGTLAQEIADSDRKYRNTSQRTSDKDHICGFYFYVYKSTDPITYGRYFIYKYGSSNSCHKGHCFVSPVHAKGWDWACHGHSSYEHQCQIHSQNHYMYQLVWNMEANQPIWGQDKWGEFRVLLNRNSEKTYSEKNSEFFLWKKFRVNYSEFFSEFFFRIWLRNRFSKNSNSEFFQSFFS